MKVVLKYFRAKRADIVGKLSKKFSKGELRKRPKSRWDNDEEKFLSAHENAIIGIGGILP